MTQLTTYYSNRQPALPVASKAVNRVRYHPRNGWASRMVGSLVQGSQDRINWVMLHTITRIPPEGQFTDVLFSNITSYRYLRLLMPTNSYGNLTELEFYRGATRLIGMPFGSLGSYQDSGNTYDKVFDGDVQTFFDAPDSNAVEIGLDLGAITGDFSASDFRTTDFFVSS